MGKIIICHCEDVSLGELLSAIEQGYKDIESIKRYTGIATGPCQGKCCLVQTLRALVNVSGVLISEAQELSTRGNASNSEKNRKTPVSVKLPTIRQPVLPMRIKDISGRKK